MTANRDSKPIDPKKFEQFSKYIFFIVFGILVLAIGCAGYASM